MSSVHRGDALFRCVETGSERRRTAGEVQRVQPGRRGKRRRLDEPRDAYYFRENTLSLSHRSSFSPLKLKFHWDQFARNFLADLLATSPTSS